MVKTLTIIPVHFHSTPEPNPDTVAALSAICTTLSLPFHTKQGTATDAVSYNTLLVETAIEHGCGKIAVPDSLDWIDAMTLTSMTQEGVYNAPAIVQKVQLTPDSPTVEITRPFCYTPDELIQKYAELREFVNAPTGIHVPDHPFLEKAREALRRLVTENPGTNVPMNFFKSQFAIQSKYMGVGTGDADGFD
jgi:hypothetical protein